ncbi:pentapeptide repeat-containing protein [Gordonia sp. SID5947]|uniref:pentapeptide repeat-containing protein n=1 Tax=Gordonia sp. SID5947 TaxID=2690315 RepID=UPI00192925A7
MTDADLTHATLIGATFNGADLTGACGTGIQWPVWYTPEPSRVNHTNDKHTPCPRHG